MKTISALLAALIISLGGFSQSPQKLSYQAVIRNSAGKLVQGADVGIRISVLQGSPSGNSVYTETHSATTNINGLVTLEIGGGATSDTFANINWSHGPYFLKTEVDPGGVSNYSITGVTQMLSVPYALYSFKAGNGFSGNYNDLTNKPITDGSETKIYGGANITVAGTGTEANPYVIYGTPGTLTTTFTSSTSFTIPSNINKIKVPEKKAKEILSGNFTLTDMYEQFQAVKKMGPFGKVLKMLPGMSSNNLPDEMVNNAEGRLDKWAVIIQSMTPKEKENPKILNSSRAKRIARGSGTTEKEVKDLLKQYIMMRKMLKQFKHKKKLPFGLGGGKGMPANFPVG